MSTQYLTPDKYAELEKELATLKTERRKEVAEQLEYAKKLGDLSENAEYHQAREEQAEVEDRIQRLEKLLKESSLIENKHGQDVITIGTTFRIEKNGDNKSFLYTIVGSAEADLSHGKISNMSPLGAALLGHKTGDKVTVSSPKGDVVYTVIQIK